MIFEGDEKEYDAVLGATDSKLGLAFVRVKDLGGKKLTSVDFAAGAEVKLGDELAGVIRTDQGFDYAPYYGMTHVVGQVTKPRSMWIVTGFLPQGHPLYTTDGRAAGIVVQQAGATEDSGSKVFLLPTKAVVGLVSQAVKACRRPSKRPRRTTRRRRRRAGWRGARPPRTPAWARSPGWTRGTGSDARRPAWSAEGPGEDLSSRPS